ncbi:hypothetical protein DE146DRAFT_481676 [Phaeosphaeria sp. MPI-PUGE-AT-0046c]|nr:hypothetical protein DE146DRAFT_481676 [Phaeosphaeria sp. MPI-PUGE-AT-0046c]
MTSRPQLQEPLPTFTFPQRPHTASSDTTPRASPAPQDSSNIASSAAVHGRPKRPGLASSRAPSESSTRSRPRHHVHTKSQSAVPTLSNLNVGHNNLPTYWQSPKMTASNGAPSSSGAADLLRQAMMQR